MKRLNRNETDNRCRGSAVQFCLHCCRAVLSQLHKAKDSILAEFGHAFRSREKMLRLAVNEAEALAWETSYPHLVFPALAAEKVQELITWSQRQQRLGVITNVASIAQ